MPTPDCREESEPDIDFHRTGSIGRRWLRGEGADGEGVVEDAQRRSGVQLFETFSSEKEGDGIAGHQEPGRFREVLLTGWVTLRNVSGRLTVADNGT